MFAEVVRTHRQRLGLTQEELATNARLGLRTIRKIEAGLVGTPRPATVRLLADAFGLVDAGRERFCQIAAGEPAASPTRSTVPMQLPGDVSAFTGRAAQLAYLDAVLAETSHQPNAVLICALSGTAGVGKTALAIHWAHRVRDQYPDGQLFIDLHGYTQGMEPIEPTEALERMLRALGVPGKEIPAGLDERAALYRTQLADKRVLVVLDNAASEAQVAPLVPGAQGSLALVTSRRQLALDHTRALSLDVLSVPDAVTLFVRIVGADRIPDQSGAQPAELVQLCGLLPLAIRIAGARLRSHPCWQLSHLIERLRDQRHRLGELAAGQRSVTAALDMSYQQLSSAQRQAYRLLGLHPGADFDAHATAALLDSTPLSAGRLLDRLLEAHLLQEPAPGRYRYHDLTRAHAAHIVTGEPAATTPDAALQRLLDYYRNTASAAMDVAYPYEREHRPQVPPAHTPRPELPDQAAALSWLDTELPNLLAAAQYAADHRWPDHLLQLSTILHRHLAIRGRYHDAETLHQQALTNASAAADRVGQLTALNGLGDIHWWLGRCAQAADYYQQALQIARATRHRSGELTALNGLGHIHQLYGRYAEATDYFQQALQNARATGHRPGELTASNGLGDIHRRQSRYAQATDRYQHALQIARATGHRPGEQVALNRLGHLHQLHGRYAQATDHYQQALQIARATGHRSGERTALNSLGRVHQLQGRYAQAADQYQRLLDIAYESGDLDWQLEGWLGLGRLRHATGDAEAAVAHFETALAIAGQLSQPDGLAQAHNGLARAHHALNKNDKARRHWQRALDILTELGIDNTDDEETTAAAIRTHLAALADR